MAAIKAAQLGLKVGHVSASDALVELGMARREKAWYGGAVRPRWLSRKWEQRRDWGATEWGRAELPSPQVGRLERRISRRSKM